MPSILITGGASGLGRAIAERYARAGYDICIADMNESRGLETASFLKNLNVDAFYHRTDVRQDADMEALRELIEQRWGGLDILVNNAGVGCAGRIENTPMEDWQWVIDINLLGVVRGCKTFTPLMLKQGSGHIVNVASMAGLIAPPKMASYNAAKAAVVSLSETLHIELEPDGIYTTLVCPSFFQTNLLESSRNADPDSGSEGMEKLLASSPISAEDIAEEVFNAVLAKEFWVLPHESARNAWEFKRLNPDQFFQGFKIESAKRLVRK